jgi:hypothetical protein
MTGIPKPRDYAHTDNPCVLVTILKEGKSAPILLSAYENFDRLTRVRNAALRLPLVTLRKLRRLHDNKGDLGAIWNTLPAGSDIAAIQQAWEAECEYMTSHFFDEQPLLDNVRGYPPSNAVNVVSGTPSDSFPSDL